MAFHRKLSYKTIIPVRSSQLYIHYTILQLITIRFSQERASDSRFFVMIFRGFFCHSPHSLPYTLSTPAFCTTHVRTGLMRKEKREGAFNRARSPWPQHHLPTNVCCNLSFGSDGQLHLVSVFTSWIIFIIILLLETFGRYNTPWEVCQTFPASVKTLEISYTCNEGICKSVVKAVSSSLQHNGVELWWPVSHLGRRHICRQWISAGKADCSPSICRLFLEWHKMLMQSDHVGENMKALKSITGC